MTRSFNMAPGTSTTDTDRPKSLCACGEELTGFEIECPVCRYNDKGEDEL